MAKTRSPNYPSASLADAVESARTLYKSAQQSVLHPEDAMKGMGYEGPSGASRSRLSALRKYGLLDESKSGVKLSDRALTILTLPEGNPERQDAINNAAAEPDLFRELAQQYPNPNADAGLIASYLVRKKFSQAGAKQAVDAFKDTMAMVKAPGEGYTSPNAGKDTGGMIDLTGAGGRAQPARVPIFEVNAKTGAGAVAFDLKVTAESGRKIKHAELKRLVDYVTGSLNELLTSEYVEDAPPMKASPATPAASVPSHQ